MKLGKCSEIPRLVPPSHLNGLRDTDVCALLRYENHPQAQVPWIIPIARQMLNI
mgnify:FL=1